MACDNGSSMCKAGFARDDAPTDVFTYIEWAVSATRKPWSAWSRTTATVKRISSPWSNKLITATLCPKANRDDIT